MWFTCVLWNWWEWFFVSHPAEVLLWPLHIARDVAPKVRKATIPIDLVLGTVCWVHLLAVVWAMLSLFVFCVVPCRGWLLSSGLLWWVIRLMLWGVRRSLCVCVFLHPFSLTSQSLRSSARNLRGLMEFLVRELVSGPRLVWEQNVSQLLILQWQCVQYLGLL